jgi:ADP-ribosyl-[dinitrogen reductase] hydrolase
VLNGAPPDARELFRRAEGCFLGVAVGDALGATVEFMTPQEIRAAFGVHDEIRGGGWLRLKAGAVTDDTEMTLCLARSVDSLGRFDGRDAMEGFVRWMRGCPADMGSTVRRGIRDYVLKGELGVPYSDWGAGNGAAMRMAPAALLTLGDGEALERIAVEQARLTHNHLLSDMACVALGRMVHRALRGEGMAAVAGEAAALVRREPAFRYEGYRGEASGYVVHTVRTVLSALFSTGSFEACLVESVNRGGDADTTGAIAGMTAGALYGVGAIPRRWLAKLDPSLREELSALAGRILALSPHARGIAGKE